MTETGGVGVFGKLPALGDFVSRALPQTFTDPFHAWLARGLAEARQRLGERFEPAYMQGPVWRFAIAPGACGDRWALGVLMPSVDAAGRTFPLAIVGLVQWTPEAGGLLIRLSGWFEELERRALLALEDGFALQPWLAELSGLPLPDPATATAPPAEWARLPGLKADLARGLCERMACEVRTTVSLFWTDGSPFVAAGALVGPGLPNGAFFVRLLADDPVGSEAAQ